MAPSALSPVRIGARVVLPVAGDATTDVAQGDGRGTTGDAAGSPGELVELGPELESATVATTAVAPTLVLEAVATGAADAPGSPRTALVVGRQRGGSAGESEAAPASVAVRVALPGRVTAGGSEAPRPLAHSRRSISRGAIVGDEVALLDADWVDTSDPGDTIIVLDGLTLAERRRVRLAGTPVAVAGWGERMLVVDGRRGELLLFAPGAVRPAARLSLGGGELLAADIAVFPAPAAAGE